MRELTRQETKQFQGLSILAMVLLHLFCTYNYEGKFTPLVMLQGVPLVFYPAQFGDFCVFAFAFCSGYGHMVQYEKKKGKSFAEGQMKKLLSVLIVYWTVLAAFSIIGPVFGKGDVIPGSVSKFLANAFLLKSSYNGAWWYISVYTVLVLLSPVLLEITDRFPALFMLGAGALIYTGAYYLRFFVHTGIAPVTWLGPFGMTLFEYLAGAVCRRRRWFSAIGKGLDRIPKAFFTAASVMILAFLVYGHTKIEPSLFIAPLNGFVVFVILHEHKMPRAVCAVLSFFFFFFTNIWLTHMFFYQGLFPGLIYRAKYPLLIYLFMLAICVGVSYVLQLVEKPLQNLVLKHAK